VIIWKEGAPVAAQPTHQQQFGGFHPQSASRVQTQSSWIKVKEHRLHESSVNSIAWAPHELGLSLACASSDGQISIITYRIEDSTWDIKSFAAHQIGCNAVSWCQSPVSDYLAALASGAQPKALTVKRIVTGGCDNLAKVWKYDEAESAWKQEAALEGHSDWVRDVSWAPSGTLIATCSQDKTVLLWSSTDDGKTWTTKPLTSEPFPDTVWRLSWSTAGNLLAVSCGDNTVTLWRESPAGGSWELVSKADQAAMAQ
jgi:protein transport protein SEC13